MVKKTKKEKIRAQKNRSSQLKHVVNVTETTMHLEKELKEIDTSIEPRSVNMTKADQSIDTKTARTNKKMSRLYEEDKQNQVYFVNDIKRTAVISIAIVILIIGLYVITQTNPDIISFDIMQPFYQSFKASN